MVVPCWIRRSLHHQVLDQNRPWRGKKLRCVFFFLRFTRQLLVGYGVSRFFWAGSHLRRLVASRRIRRSLSAAPAGPEAVGKLFPCGRETTLSNVVVSAIRRRRPHSSWLLSSQNRWIVGSMKIVSKSLPVGLSQTDNFVVDQHTLTPPLTRCMFLWRQNQQAGERERRERDRERACARQIESTLVEIVRTTPSSLKHKAVSKKHV